MERTGTVRVTDVAQYLTTAVKAAGLPDDDQRRVIAQFLIAFGDDIGADLDRALFDEITSEDDPPC
jgi:hypothetical protein